MARQDQQYDHHITIFSPAGHLYQMEYAFKAATSSGLTAVAVRGKESAVFCTQKKVPDKLIDPASVTSVYTITPLIGCLMTGLPADCVAQVDRIRHEADEFKYDYGYDIPVHALARKVADICQLCTQEASYRALACMCVLIGVDDEAGPQLFKVDPAGHYLPFKATATGPREQDAQNWLERRVDEFADLDEDGSVQTAIMGMQHVLSTDFRGSDLEVGVVGPDRRFRKLDADEIERHLVAISERDT